MSESGIEKALLEKLNGMEPQALIKWSYERYGERAGLITSFQNTGCVMIDMASKVAPKLRVITIDTLRLHSETYELMDEIEERYGIEIEHFKPDHGRLERMIKQHGEYLFFDSVAKQEYCCKVRKVEPNQRALFTVDVWITGLRKDQSEHRSDVPKASAIVQDRHEIIKLCPLVDWSEEQVREYINENDVPNNKLYEMGYTSIGCKICTTPTRPGEHKRAGRWRWMNQNEDEHKKECGIHSKGGGI